jgi:hypothetical protein
MRTSVVPLVMAFLVLSSGCERQPSHVDAASEPDLLQLMASMERFSEKLYLAASAGNWTLAAFYAHELEEVGADLRDAGFEKGGIDLGSMTSELFLPAVERLDRAIDVSRAEFQQAFSDVVASCNACHAAAGYPFIQIVVPTEDRPYPMQSFSP